MTAARGAVLLICAIGGGCKAGAHGIEADSKTQSKDAGADAHEAAAAFGLDAAPAPDDALLPGTSSELMTRARHLLEAIAQDDATLASDIVFPRDGWLAMRDADDPGKDWDTRVAMPFRRQTHVLSRRHRDLNHVQVVSLELGGAVRQTTTRRRGWKKPLWTVSDSRLTFVANGLTRVLSIREMVAWRGAWYVTRLR